MKIFESLTNHLLLAMPSLEGSDFSRSVTLICEHNDSGALGIVVNCPTSLSLTEVFVELNIQQNSLACSDAVHFGGPVQQKRGLVLHEYIGNWELTLPITDNLGLTTSKDILNALARGDGPKSFLFALGYAGWSAGQLEEEIHDNSWLTVPACREILFETPVNDRWIKAAALSGIDITQISSQVGHA